MSPTIPPLRRALAPRLLALLLVLALAPVAGLCQGADALAPAAPTQVSVQLQWRHQWEFAGFYAALEQGYYRDAGLAVELREYRSGIGIMDEVVSGRADFGTYYSTVIAERMRGQPIRLLASYLKRSPLVLLVRHDIHVPPELKGLRLMAEPNELFSANFRQMFARYGLAERDIVLVPHAFTVEPFVRGEVDAMTAFATNEPFLLRSRGVDFNVIDPSDYGVALYDLNLFTSADYARAHPERVRAFIAATNRGWDYALAHSDELVELILRRYNTQGKTREHLRFEAHQTYSAILPELYPVGSIDPIHLGRIQDLFVEAGLAAQRLPVADLVFDARAADSAPGATPAAPADARGKSSAATRPGEGDPSDASGPGTDPLISTLRARVRLTDAEREMLAAHRDLVLGVDGDWQPLIIRNPDGSFAGIDGDTVAILNAVLGTRIRFRTGTWASLVEQARRREIDGLSSSAVHPERAADFLFTAPYTRIGQSILVRAGNPLRIHKVTDLSGKRIGYGRGNLSTRKLIDSMAGAIPVAFPSDHEALNALLGGDVDALVGIDTFMYYLADRDVTGVEPGIVLESTIDLVFSIRKDRPLLVSAIDKVLLALPQSERMAIKQRYLKSIRAAGEDGVLALTAPERAYLDSKGGRLAYCFSPVWVPYDYAQDGVHRGVFKDYLELFARKLGVALQPVPARDWPEALRFAQERRCDLISGAVRTAERERYLSFTTPYVSLTQVLVAREDAPFVPGIESLKGRPIGVPAASAMAARLKARFPDQAIFEMKDLSESTAAIETGRVYAAVVTLEHAAEILEQSPGRIRIIGKLDEPYPIGVAVRNDAPALRSMMQKAVDSITPAERDHIQQRQTTFMIEEQLDLTRLWQALGGILLVAVFLGYRHYELTRLNRRLVAARDAADVANRAKSHFLANMSHEIRTPLNAVLNLAALGSQGGDPQRLRGLLQAIERAGGSLLAVVNEILDFSRIEGGFDVHRPAPFVPADLVERVRSIVEPLAAAKGLAFGCDLGPGLAGLWWGDAHKIERILINLLGNAVKFTDRGQVRLRVFPQGTRWLLLEVADTGSGIAADHLPDLFVPFHQGDNSPSRQHGGTGLGLAIVKRLAALMNGEIRVDSRPGEGTRFSIRLPLERLEAATPGAPPRPADPRPADPAPPAHAQPEWISPRAGEAARRLRPRRVLTVEDNEVNRQIVCEFLARLGVAAEAADCAPAALACLDAQPQGFGLVLMDVQMPGMDGYEATQRLRADPRFAALPVVAITAHVQPEDRRRCREAGMDDHVPKPFAFEDLARTVARWIPLDVRDAREAREALAPADPGAPGWVRPDLARGAARIPAEARCAVPGGWIDARAGAARVGGDADLFRQLLSDFLGSYGPRLEILDAEESENRSDGVRRLAHMARGTAPMLGADRLAALAAAVEDAFLAGAAPRPQDLAAFRIALAGTLADARVLAVGEDAGPARDAGDEDQGRILIVDDDPVAASLLAGLLGERHGVLAARDGPEGLALALTEPHPDLILLDVEMAGLDGYSVCRALKADPASRDIPVIFVTGRGCAQDERRGLELGAVDYIHKPFEREVVRARVRNHLAAKRQGDALARLSEQDGLTGLPNRRRLDAYLAQTWRRALAAGDPLALLMMDVDHFKAYNDRYGHAAGDDCLRRISAALARLCASRGGLVARYGGEELVWILPGADLEAARATADLALAAVRDLSIPHAARPGGHIVTLSIGAWSCRPGAGMRMGDCLAEADRRLYRAKSEGRDRAVT